MQIDEREMISATEAARNPARLFREAAQGRRFVILTNNTPTAAVVGMNAYRELAELREREERVKMLAVTMARLATDTGRRHDLADVITELGYTEAQIDAVEGEEAD